MSEDFEFGPVQFLLIGFEGGRPGQVVVDAVKELLESQTIHLLDVLLVSRGYDGLITAVEVEDLGEEYGFSGLELEASGVATNDDVQQLASAIPPGTSAVFAAIELLWAKHLASRLAEAGGFLIHSDYIPAPIVNAELAALRAETQDAGAGAAQRSDGSRA